MNVILSVLFVLTLYLVGTSLAEESTVNLQYSYPSGSAPYPTNPTSYPSRTSAPYPTSPAYPANGYSPNPAYSGPYNQYPSAGYNYGSIPYTQAPYTYELWPYIPPYPTYDNAQVEYLKTIVAEPNDKQGVFDCPNVKTPACDAFYKYRQPDGSCNNLNISWWGQARTPYKRLLKPAYQDLNKDPRKLGVNGRPLKSPREISTRVHYPQDIYKDITHLVPMFGQFVIHDVTKTAHTLGEDGDVKKCTCDSKSYDCVNIPIPKNDYNFQDKKCLIQVRERDSRECFNCDLGYRNQLNDVNSFVDLSVTYGSNKEEEAELRAFYGGRLEVSYFKDSNGPLLPSRCTGSSFKLLKKTNVCFLAGDNRVNQHPLMIGMHTIFLREHNRIVTELAKINPHWDDERLFQEGKRILTAVFQNIAYWEWLPLVIGYELHKIFGLDQQPADKYFEGYNPEILPNTAAEFSGAAARFGHGLVRPYMSRVNEQYKTTYNDSLRDLLWRPDLVIPGDNLDQFIRGALCDMSLQNLPHINEELQDWVIHDLGNDNPTHFFSLPAWNINRGRELGLEAYNYYRELAGLNLAQTYDDLSWISPKNLKNLRAVYKDVFDIDLFSGGMSEHHVRGGILGPTFAYIIARGFRDWKYGDRFFYENSNKSSPNAFTLTQLNSIRQVRLNSILCNTLNLKDVTYNVFLRANKDRNPYLSCNSVYPVNLELWRESYYPNYNTYGSYPTAGYPSGSYPQTGYPSASYPPGSYPPASYPTRYPASG
jgi:peroxidase